MKEIMDMQLSKTRNKEHKVYKVVLTGGPCGGKTTGQVRLSNFFESLGWKVFRSPETACVLMSGGIKWVELSPDQGYKFQEDLLKTMMQIENTYFSLAATYKKNCLVICDRGTMDASAFLKQEDWQRMMAENCWNPVAVRDNRYDQIIHMVTAADGAEEFYTTEEHATRYENIDEARELDQRAAGAWVGHPYYDVIDNSTDFETKLMRMIQSVCQRTGIVTGDRLVKGSKKRKFLIKCLPTGMKEFPQFEDFQVVHHYLVTPNRQTQARLRRRGQNEHWTYTHTIRRPEINNQSVELKAQLTNREYVNLLAQADSDHYTVYKIRRCFLWHNQYFQMDIYQQPCPPKCDGLIILETYTTKRGSDLELPDFLQVEKEVTDDPEYSMFNLSLKPEVSDERRCRSFSGSDITCQPGSPVCRLRSGSSDCMFHPAPLKEVNGELIVGRSTPTEDKKAVRKLKFAGISNGTG